MMPFHVGVLGIPALIILTMRYIDPAMAINIIRNIEKDSIVIQISWNYNIKSAHLVSKENIVSMIGKEVTVWCMFYGEANFVFANTLEMLIEIRF